MGRLPDVERRRELLDAIVAYLAEHGLADVSLRPMAATLGVSVNALVHHFGSKEQIVVAALHRATEAQQDVADRWLTRRPDLSQADLLRRWWRWITASPGNLAVVRLGIEAAALDATTSGLPGDVRSEQISTWRTNIEQRLVAEGVAPIDAGVEASLVKAMFTGLVVDLLATGERRRVTHALEVGLARMEHLVASHRHRRGQEQRMYDVEIMMRNQPGELALMGETLGQAGISVEGGGMFLVGTDGVAHFLFDDGPAAREALEAAGMTVTACREVLVQRLAQGEPGQLGKLCRAMADAGVNIEVLYSDHDHQLVLVVDDPVRGAQVSNDWMRRRPSG